MKRIVSLLLVVGLLLGGSFAVDAGIPDPGPGKTNIFMQNLGPDPATLSLVFTNGDTGGTAWTTDTGGTVAPKAARMVLYPSFGGTITNGWAGAVEVQTNQPLAAIVNMFWTSSANVTTAATYTGVDAPSTELYLPNLLVRDGRQTRVTVQNTEDATADVVLHFYNRDGVAVGEKSVSVPAGSEKTLYLDQVPEANFSATVGTGSAYITATKNIAAIATLHWEASPSLAAASEAYSGVSSGDTTLWVPGVFRRLNWNGTWNFNATVVQNLGLLDANVTVEFLNLNSTAQYSMTDTIAPKAAAGYNTLYQGTMDPTKFSEMVGALGDDWQGTLKFTCTNGQPLAGVCFYFAPSTGATDNIAYNAIRGNASTNRGLSLPATYRKLTGAASDQWSTALVQNVTNEAGTLDVEFYNTDGAKVGSTYTVPIPASGSVRLNLKAGLELPSQALTDIGNLFYGAMYVTPSSNIQVIGVNYIFYLGGRNAGSGYAAFPVPAS